MTIELNVFAMFQSKGNNRSMLYTFGVAFGPSKAFA